MTFNAKAWSALVGEAKLALERWIAADGNDAEVAEAARREWVSAMDRLVAIRGGWGSGSVNDQDGSR